MSLQIVPLSGMPEIEPGMNLGVCLLDRLEASGLKLEPEDILAVTQKVVSKAEGRIVDLGTVQASAFSTSVARQTKKDPRLVEIILRESRRIVRIRNGVLICETHHGFICANAGVDQSNTAGFDKVTLLPKNPDESARALSQLLGCGVILTDTFGRVWREGLVDAAIGLARVPAFIDLRGESDTHGRPLRVTLLAAADALAAVAGLVMGKTTRTPAALIRGFRWTESSGGVNALLRERERDLFL